MILLFFKPRNLITELNRVSGLINIQKTFTLSEITQWLLPPGPEKKKKKVPFKYMKYVFTEMPLVLHQRFRVNHLGFQRAFNQLTGCSKVSLRRKSLSCLHELDLWVD